jgi:hypothetical protein
MRSAFGPAVREIWRYLYRLGPFGSPKQKHPSHAQEAKPGSLSPADTKSHLARPPAIRPLPLIARSQPLSRHGIPRALRSPLQRFSDLLSAILFVTCKDAGNSLQNGVAGELENEQKIVAVDSGSFRTPFYIQRRETVTSRPMTESYDTKSGVFRRSAPDLV